MGKWFDQAREIEKLRQTVREQATQISSMRAKLKEAGIDGAENAFGVSAKERELVAEGKAVGAIKEYRERTGADLLTAKNAIDSVS